MFRQFESDVGLVGPLAIVRLVVAQHGNDMSGVVAIADAVECASLFRREHKRIQREFLRLECQCGICARNFLSASLHVVFAGPCRLTVIRRPCNKTFRAGLVVRVTARNIELVSVVQ